jgi:hypothetical protein
MSALPPKGGIRLCEWHVRFVSIADMMHVRDTLMKRYELCEVVCCLRQAAVERTPLG